MSWKSTFKSLKTFFSPIVPLLPAIGVLSFLLILSCSPDAPSGQEVFCRERGMNYSEEYVQEKIDCYNETHLVEYRVQKGGENFYVDGKTVYRRDIK